MNANELEKKMTPLSEAYSARALSGLLDEDSAVSSYILLGILYQLERLASNSKRVDTRKDLYNNARSR
jgi:hypothetical protein